MKSKRLCGAIQNGRRNRKITAPLIFVLLSPSLCLRVLIRSAIVLGLATQHPDSPSLYRILSAGSTMIAVQSGPVYVYKLRDRLKNMTDGKYPRKLAGMSASGTPDPYKVQWDEAIKEWRTRYPIRTR